MNSCFYMVFYAIKVFTTVHAAFQRNYYKKEKTPFFNTTPLHQAAENGHLEIAKLLLEKGADMNVTNLYRTSPLGLAVELGHIEVVRLLLDRWVTVHSKDTTACDAILCLAAASGHHEIVSLLLNRGVDVNAKCHYGETVLHVAAKNGYVKIVRLLLLKGADLLVFNKDDKTPCDLANENLEETDSGDEENLHVVQRHREKTLALLGHLTAFHKMDAVDFVTYIYRWASIDLNLMKEDLKHSEFQNEKMQNFLAEFQIQAPAHTTSNDLQITVISGKTKKRLSVENAKQKVVELVSHWMKKWQELQALRAFQQGDGDTLRIHLEQGKAVDMERLRMDLAQTPFSQQRFWSLLHCLKQGGVERNEIAQTMIELMEDQLTLKNIAFQVLRDNTFEEDLYGAHTADEWIEKYMRLSQKQ